MILSIQVHLLDYELNAYGSARENFFTKSEFDTVKVGEYK